MKVLLFEFVCGGGFAGQTLTGSLVREGQLMLRSLAAELLSLPDLELDILLDYRCRIDGLPERVRVITIGAEDDYRSVLENSLPAYDRFWPIAPESAGILTGLAEMALEAGVSSVLSTVDALVLCGSKINTCWHLLQSGIEAIDTRYFPEEGGPEDGVKVIKPDDGVGCEGGFIVHGRQYPSSAFEYNEYASGRLVVQPYLTGRALSLSCLCKDGRGWLLCRNEQMIEVDKGRFSLKACRVNIGDDSPFDYQRLVERVAAAIPGLWGYIGIDLIETEGKEPVILEINPRLTTSYCAIFAATGINVAQQVLRMSTSDPAIACTRRKTLTVDIQQGDLSCENE